jgi:hypothetical protein
MPSQDFQDYRRTFRDTLESEQGAAGVARTRQAEYDPYAAADKSAKAQFETFDRDLYRSLESMRGSQVGSGRLRTGFGYDDQDRLWEGAVEGLNREVAKQSMTAAGLDLRNIEGMQGARELTAEMSSGGMDQELALEEQERAKSGGIGGLLGGLAGGIGGFIIGGPVGAAAGAQIGSSAGSGIGTIFG